MKAILLFYCAMQLVAQTGNNYLMTDTELASDGSVTQYVLHDYARESKMMGVSSMILGLRAADGSQFLQFAAGPRFQGEGWFVNTYFGGAKGGRLIAAAVVKIDLPHKLEIVAASDPKFPIGHLSRAPEIWFTRVWIGRRWLYFRHDNLQVAGFGNETSKIGIELRKKIGCELYSFAYHDYQKHDWGVTAGARVKFR